MSIQHCNGRKESNLHYTHIYTLICGAKQKKEMIAQASPTWVDTQLTVTHCLDWSFYTITPAKSKMKQKIVNECSCECASLEVAFCMLQASTCHWSNPMCFQIGTRIVFANWVSHWLQNPNEWMTSLQPKNPETQIPHDAPIGHTPLKAFADQRSVYRSGC